LLSSRHIRRLPVTRRGRLVGILSRHDVLRAFERSDDAILEEITEEIVSKKITCCTDDIRVDVREGVVTLQGTLDHRSTGKVLRFHVDRVDGVTKVVDEIRYRAGAGRSRGDEVKTVRKGEDR